MMHTGFEEISSHQKYSTIFCWLINMRNEANDEIIQVKKIIIEKTRIK